MATETTETTTSTPGQEGGKAAPTKPEATPPQADPKEPVNGQPGAKNGVSKAGSKASDDEDTPTGDEETIHLTGRALKSRLERASKKSLRDAFGTDNVEEIQAKIKRAQELEEKEEERRRSELSEKQRLEEDVKKANARAEEAERRASRSRDRREIDRESSRIHKIAAKHIDDDYVEDQDRKLAAYLLKNFTAKQLAKGVPDKVIEDFYAQLAKDKPKLAKDQPSPAPDNTVKRPLTNTPGPTAPSQQPAGAGEKSVRPGPNQMSRKELQEKYGYNP